MGAMGRSGKQTPTAPAKVSCGYFGKVPVHGDFVGQGLPRGVEDAVDTWLRAAMRASQSELGRDWLDAFLVMPVWRFAASPGVFGQTSVLGVMMPSVDRVGRYYPLTIAASIPLSVLSALEVVYDTPFYEQAETATLSILSEGFSLGRLDAAIHALPLPGTDAIAKTKDAPPDPEVGTFWWTRDTDPIWIEGLPDPDAFTKTFMIKEEPAAKPDPALDDAPVRTQRLKVIMPPDETSSPRSAPPQLSPNPSDPLPPSTHPPLLSLTSASASLKGLRSSANTDVSVTAREGQAFTLLSGLGEEPSLPAALNAVGPILADIAHPFAMNDLIAEAKGKLGRANATLTARATASGQTCAASSATLLIQAQRHAVLWAGSAHVFLLREGELLPLTRPHLDPRLRNIVTRALGAGPNLSLDSAIGQVCAGDRFVLTSPGLFDALGPHEIGQTLSDAPDPDKAVSLLTQNALIAGAIMDASALCVFAHAR